MYAGLNMWVLKPNDCNRGRGVQVFNKLDELRKQLSDSVTGVTSFLKDASLQPQNQSMDQTGTLPSSDPKEQSASKVKSDLFVIQKYIEEPMLINERKFDIRLWVLITHEHDCHLFDEGYIRMSSYKYTLDEE